MIFGPMRARTPASLTCLGVGTVLCCVLTSAALGDEEAAAQRAPTAATADAPQNHDASGAADSHTDQPSRENTIVDEITVTATREEERLVETPASVGIVKAETIAADKPSHPAQVMGQMPGVAVAVTNGEGHSTAIRQPFTTSPVYLFLEDGIPTRSTGFFNHNALYEINVPQAGGIEVLHGPSSALYGSDAIGGVVNVLTSEPPAELDLQGSFEGGDFGWRRALVGVGDGSASGSDRFRVDGNVTATDGWRDATAYDRSSGTARWDHLGEHSWWKTVVAFSDVDQDTGANSPLVRADYEHQPTLNYFPIAFREVGALRVSSTWERDWTQSLVTVAPYYRDDSMDLLASFTLNFDPTLSRTANRSFGVMAKWRRDFDVLDARVIGGLDADWSPGERREDRVLTVPTGTGASRVFTDYSVGARVYDYDVTYRGASPYVHAELSPTSKLRLTTGLRYDDLRYDLDNSFDTATATALAPPGASGGTVRFYGQAADGEVGFHRLSPKLGATYAVSDHTHVFVSYNEGFRAPSEGQMFRPSSATTAPAAVELARSALGLEPIKARQAEVGVRGVLGRRVSYDVAIYDLEKRDDIVTIRDLATNFTQTANAGETRHRGAELGLGAPLSDHFRFDLSASYAEHEYVDWVTSNGDFSGSEMDSAPRVLGNARLTWTPLERARVQLEWSKVGSYWLDAANTTKYEGHDLLNLRANWDVARHVGVFASLYNVSDERYADSASITSSTPVFSPGMPRTATIGIEVKR
jgi:outer membrane receptor protein involved in Fe transport